MDGRERGLRTRGCEWGRDGDDGDNDGDEDEGIIILADDFLVNSGILTNVM